MKTKGKRPEGIVFTNADPRYAGKLDDPQEGDATMLMQQVREVMTVNQEMTDESSWIWLTSEQMKFPLRSDFANESHGEAGSSKQCNEFIRIHLILRVQPTRCSPVRCQCTPHRRAVFGKGWGR